MNMINDPFKFYNPVSEILREQQESWRRMIQPTRFIQQTISNMATSAMQPCIDQQKQFREQIASVTKISGSISNTLGIGSAISCISIAQHTLISKTPSFAELLGNFPIPSVTKVGIQNIKLGVDWDESLHMVNDNIKHLEFLNFGISNNYFKCDNIFIPTYSDILDSVTSTTSDIYESVEVDESVKSDDIQESYIIERFEEDLKWIDACNDVQKVLYYFDKAYLSVEYLPYEFKLELYSKFQNYIIDVLYACSIALGVALITILIKYLLRDNQNLLDIFKK